MADQINAVITFYGSWELRTKWMSFRLQDGTGDGALYDTKRDAVRHVSNENYYAFFCFRSAMGGVNAFDMQLFLDMHRHAYEGGNRLADPDDMTGGRDLIMSIKGHEQLAPAPVELLVPDGYMVLEDGKWRFR
jgi:hypothetical protein